MSVSVIILLTALNLMIFLAYYLRWTGKSAARNNDAATGVKPATSVEVHGNDPIRSALGHELLVSLFKRSALGILLFNDEGKLINLNNRAIEILELPEDNMPGSLSEMVSAYPGLFIIDPEEKRNYSTIVSHNAELVKGPVIKYIRVNNYWYSSQLSRSSLIVQLNDYTKFKQFELDLVKAKEEANAISRMKSIFLANMSHEIRTPMNGIIGFSALLKEDLREPDQLEMAERVYSSAIKLMETLEAVMDLSNLEAEHMVPEKRHLDLKELLNQIYYEYKDLSARKSLNFEISLPEEPVQLFVDENILVKVMRQILSNAVKFTENGSIALGLNIEHFKTHSLITISVEDTGIGISLKDQEMIFDDFRQVSEGAGRNYEGIGIGLSIVKRLCEMIDAQIAIKSTPGKGSRFTLIFTDKIKK